MQNFPNFFVTIDYMYLCRTKVLFFFPKKQQQKKKTYRLQTWAIVYILNVFIFLHKKFDKLW